MFSSNDVISVRQLRLLLILNLFSTTSLILPRMAAESAGRDGWISVVVGTVFAIVYALIILHLGYKFPNQSIFDYGDKLIGKFFTFVLGLLFIIKFIFTAAFGVRLFSELIKETLLKETPVEVIIMCMLLVASYVARKGYECRARMAEILIWIVFIPICLILLFALPKVNISHVMPVFVNEPLDILKGGYGISLTYTAIDFLLIALPYTNRPKETKRPVLFSIVFIGVFNLILCLITFGVLGVEGTQRQIWPVMNIMQVIKMPGAFIERQDALMTSFWILSIFAVINAYIFFISLVTQKICRLKEQNFLVLPFLPFIFLISLLPDNVVQVYEYTGNIMRYVGLFFLVLVPVVLIILAKVKKVGDPIEKD